MFDENIEPQLQITKNKGKNSSSNSSNLNSKQNKGRTIEEMYQKKSQLEHILLRPDTYVGSVEKQTQQMWVYDNNKQKITMKSCTFVPGLYKIFDEIIVNAADNKQRDPTMNRIEVDINPDENTIRVWNNGAGIPIAIHQEHNIYVPELIFGHLLTGSNFDDDEQKTTGGRNGYGAKLANIFSSEFIIETADHSRGLKFKQVFRKNMTERSEPEIKKYSGSDFTSVTFKPDLERFKMSFLDDDIVSLLSKRVFDIAGTNLSSGAKLNIFLNNTKLNINSFQQYLALFDGLSEPCAFEKVNDKWEVGVAVSDGSFQQVSYVNSICTTKGGQHVNYLVDQITQKLAAAVKKKNKGEEVKAAHIKNHLAIFVNALIVNPAFDSQTKENLTTKSSSFGSTCPLSDKFLKKIENSGVIDNILSWAKFKQTAELKKKGGSKRSKLIGITKLDDANFAGTSKSKDCTLILTEGDSAKALAISGLGVVGRDYYGVFPLKGKLLNVREASHAQIMKNEEIQNVAKILGLTFGKVYEETSSLRYGHLMIMTDQDHDGSHIKGLLINFLHHFWPSLLQIDGFLQQFITPIVKCSKGNKEIPFYTIPEYLTWKEEHNDAKGWKVKYYKGLGTSTSSEAKDYFSNLDTHEIDFSWNDNSNDAIEMAFSKKRVDDRKQWLLAMDPDVYIDYDVDSIAYDDFVNQELILFSHADNQRSIPHLIDGFKPSQRKVLYSCFKRNLKQEIKVAQLAGYVSEHSAYHHGEASLTQTIIGMAQNFVGCGNINLLTPCGQFGTRLMGGKDAASPRYVFTKLETITRCIFHPDDDFLLNYLDDDGQSIEPLYYVPIIPMVLVNGSEGIGTGWSTSIPTYNPRDIIHNLKAQINQDGSDINLHPWFRGFTGEVRAKTGRDSNNYVVAGIIEQIDESTVVISELPVGKSTTDYKQFLESMVIGTCENGIIKEFKENHTDTTVLFTLTIPPEKLVEINAESGGLIKKFKIEGSTATSNMHVFDTDGRITKFEKAQDIMMAFYEIRMQYYEKRKNYLASKFSEEWEKIDNRVRFILAVVHGELIVSNRKKKDILAELKREGYKMFFPTKKLNGLNDEQQDNNNENDNNNESDDNTNTSKNADNLDKGYDYLLSMKIWNLTQEKVDDLCKERDSKRDALDNLMRKSAGQLWLEDLETLEVALDEFEENIEREKNDEIAARKKATKAGTKRRNDGKKASKKRTNKYDSDEDNMSESDESEFEVEKKQNKTKSKAPVKNNNNTTTTTTTKSTQAAKNPLTVATSKPASVVEKISVESGLTLAQRLLSRIDLNSATTTATTTTTTTNGNVNNSSLTSNKTVSKASEETKKKTTKKATDSTTVTEPKKRAPKKTTQKKVIDDENDDIEIDDASVEILPVREKPSRSAAVAALKNVYNLANDSEEDDVVDGNDDDDNDEYDSEDIPQNKSKKRTLDESEDEYDFIESDNESNFSEDNDSDSDSQRKTKKTARKFAPLATTKTTTKTTKVTKESKPSKSTTTKSKKTTEDDDDQPKVSKKRQTKASASTTSTTVTDVYSPGITTPRDIKKPRKQANKNSDVERIESLVQTVTEKPATKAVAPQKKAAAATKTTSSKVATTKTTKSTTKAATSTGNKTTTKTARRIIDSSDEEDEEEDEVVYVPKKSPKPVRNTRKVIKSYAVDSDEDDEVDENSDNSDEESDFEE